MHSHSHGPLDGDDETTIEIRPDLERSMWIAVVVCVIVALLGVVLLWPSGSDTARDPSDLGGETVQANVVDATVDPCSFDPLLVCRNLTIVPSEGDLVGERLSFEQSIDSLIRTGDTILVDVGTNPDGTTRVSFFDFARSTPMLLLALLFVTAIVLLGRWRGLGALAGLVASLAIIVGFVLPAILDGANPVMVAVLASGVIAAVALFLSHGVNPATGAALLSSIASLAITALLAWIFVGATNLTGLANDSIGFLDALGGTVDARGLLRAGVVSGSRGVLDDVTVTQVSAVWELKRARPSANTAELYRRAVRSGRDHIASTVNTLFLAYAGAALPLLLLFEEAGQSLSSAVTREVVAVEVVRALVGSVGLVASVPISTGLAAALLGSATGTDSTTEQPNAGDRLPPPRPD